MEDPTTTKGRCKDAACAKETFSSTCTSSSRSSEQNIRLQSSSAIILNGGLNKEEGTRIIKCSSAALEGARGVVKLVRRLPLEWIGLSAVLIVVWGLLMLPIIYFHTEIVSG